MVKKYTLYFKLVNKYGHDCNVPILTLDLMDMDVYTSAYKNFVDLFNCLPSKLNKFIRRNYKEGLNLDSNDVLKDLFFIADTDLNMVTDVMFEDDRDILYVKPKEIENILMEKSMSFNEFQMALLKTRVENELKTRYDFFVYLYNEYVKNKNVKCMIDRYDVEKRMSFKSEDDILIASLVTDKDNLMVLNKKISQTLEQRRSLALGIKKFFKNDKLINDSKSSIRNKALDTKMILSCINDNFKSFKKEYDKEYKMSL